MLLHVSVCDHHQGACTWAWLKLQLLRMFGKNMSLCTCSGVAVHVHNYVFLPNFLTNVTLARPKYKLPDDGHTPKHVAAF